MTTNIAGTDKEVADFWLPIGKWLMATYGYNDNIVLELQNESGRNYWDPNYARSVKDAEGTADRGL